MAQRNPVIERILITQVYVMSGKELRAWRAAQPGKFGRANKLKGWSQERAAAWIGKTTRTWQLWEADSHPIPEHAVRRIVEYTQSLDQKLDQMLA